MIWLALAFVIGGVFAAYLLVRWYSDWSTIKANERLQGEYERHNRVGMPGRKE